MNLFYFWAIQQIGCFLISSLLAFHDSKQYWFFYWFLPSVVMSDSIVLSVSRAREVLQVLLVKLAHGETSASQANQG